MPPFLPPWPGGQALRSPLRSLLRVYNREPMSRPSDSNPNCFAGSAVVYWLPSWKTPRGSQYEDNAISLSTGRRFNASGRSILLHAPVTGFRGVGCKWHCRCKAGASDTATHNTHPTRHTLVNCLCALFTCTQTSHSLLRAPKPAELQVHRRRQHYRV